MSYLTVSYTLARLHQEDLLREAAETRRADLLRPLTHWSAIRLIVNRLTASLRQTSDRPRLIHSLRGEFGTTPTT